ncbi:MAG: PKD domain-containing protein [Bacteroidia bacterium]
MKNPLHYLVTSLFLVFSSAILTAQPITGYIVSPTPVLECNNTQVTINGILPCGNATITGTAHSIVGNVLFVDVFIFQPFICLPIILPYSVTETVGNIPAGSYTITIRYYENGVNLANMSGPLTVASCCSVNSTFTASSLTGCQGDSLTFTATDPNLSSYSWVVAANVFSTDSVAGYTFNTPGNYLVTLTGGDGSCTTSSSLTVSIKQPQISFSQVVNETCPGTQNGSINAQATGGTAPYAYLWSTGGTSQNISQLSAGVYSLTVTDNNGCTDTDSTVVSSGVPVTASFSSSAAFSKLCPGDSVLFTGNATGATQYNWKANGVLFSQSPAASYTFGDTGTFTITLIAANVTCADSFSQTFHVSSPVLSATGIVDETCSGTFDGSIDLTVGSGISPYTYLWSNGSTSEDQAQLAAGDYSVVVTDSLGCTATDTFTVGSSQSVFAQFTYPGSTSLCPGDSVSFTNASTTGSTSIWLSDGMPFATTQDAGFVFPDSGTTAISLVINLLVCTDTTTTVFTVNDAPKVTTQITGETCPESEDGIIDLNLAGGVGPFSFDWSNGGQTEDLSGLGAGAYGLMLTFGPSCEWTDTFEVVRLGGLTAAYNYTIQPNGIQFTDMSDTTAVTWVWDFGDGTGSSSLPGPFYEYSLKGDYQVCLTVTDRFGCADTVCEVITFTAGLEGRIPLNIRSYPNPATSEFWLDMAAITGQPVEIRLYDFTGRLVFSHSETASPLRRISLEGLSTGIYPLIIFTEEGLYETRIRKE